MKRLYSILSILILLFISVRSYSQSKTGIADSLEGFNYKGAMHHANEMKTDKEKAFFLNHAKRTYKIAKYNLYPQKNTNNAKAIDNSTYQGPQPAGCSNIDFESGNTSGWTVTGDNQIVTSGTDPFGGFPRVYPGGTASLKLNDNNTSGSKTTFSAQATRVIPVSSANSQFQLHFAFVLLNFPHPANAAATFEVYFLNSSNTTVTCPQFSCYFSTPPGTLTGMPAGAAQTGANGVNIGNQSYPTTYVPWQTVSMDLTPYIGQNLTAVIKCDWCLYNYDWAYCYIDADCAPITPTTAAVCPGGQLCGPSGMYGYTWTPPAGPVVTTSCITTSAIGTYTLQYTPFSSCGPSTQTNTYSVLPKPTVGLTTANVCNSYTITNTGTGPPAVQSYSFAGPSPPGSFTTTSSTSPVSFLTAGTYTIYQTITNSAGCSNTASLVVNVPAGPNPAFTIPTPTQCITGNSFSFNAVQTTGTHTFDFNPTVGAPPSGSSSSYGPVSFTAPGTYTVTHTITNSGCTAQASSVVVVSPMPTVTANNNSPICVGGNVSFTSSGGGTYSWTGPNSFNSAVQNPTITSISMAGAGIYTVNVNLAGCLGSATTQVSISTPTASAGNTGPYCAGQTISLTGSAGSTYTWSGPGGYSSSAQNPNIASSTAAMSGTYNFTVNLGGCFASGSTNVTVNALPVPNANSNSPICEGQTLNLTGSAANTYTWNGPNSFSSNSQSPSIPTASTNASGTYTFMVTDGNNCTNSVTTVVVVNSNPPLSTNNPTVCLNQTINLTASNGGASYAWSGPGGYSSGVQNPNIPNATMAMNGAYTVTMTTAAGCSNTAVANVNVFPLPSPTITSNSPVCVGGQLNLNGSGGATYNWTGPNVFNSNQQNTSISPVTMAAAGVYTLLASAGSCTAQTTAMIFINPLPNPNIVTNSPICIGNDINLSATGGTAFVWAGPNSFMGSNQTETVTAATLVNSGTYTVVVTDSSGCVNFTTANVVVNSQPVVGATGTTVCQNSSAQLTANGGVTYSWFGPGGYTSSSQNPVLFNVGPASSGQYTVYVTDANTCTNTAVASIIVNPAPVPNANVNSPICINDIMNLSATGGVAYNWSGPNGFFSSVQSPTILASSASISGIYQVTVTDANACTASTTINAIVNPNPVPQISSSTNVGCAPLCVNYTVQSIPTASTAYWTFGNGESANGVVNTVSCYNAQGVYTINATVVDMNGCLGQATYTAEVYPKPTADFNHAPLKPIINIDGDVVFTDASWGANIVSWNWFFMNTAQYTSTLQNPTFLYTDPGNYVVALVVKSDKGCSDTLLRPLVVGEDYGLYVPNAFTPNADGFNDFFQPKGFGITKYELFVFDRWGEKIFHTKEFTEGWDGTYQGRGNKPCEEAVYTWLIQCTDVFGKSHELKGHVTLLK